MTPEPLAFLEYEFTTSSLLAALATRRETHPTYAADATVGNKEKFKLWLRNYLLQVGKTYQVRNLSEAEHLSEIRRLVTDARRTHRLALHNGKFRFGVAQKVLNLYLKYLWSAGLVETVHHCPLDGIISREAKLGYEWNTSDSETEYVQAISRLRSHVGTEQLQEWEARTFEGKRGAA
jgi:hypothetical protein